MCHIHFMSAAMDSWSGVRGHAVIFHHVSAPPELTARVRIQERRGLSCQISATGKTLRKNKTESRKRDGETKRKLITSKQMAPQASVAPTGTWRDNSLHLRVTSAAERGGALKHDSVCVHFCLLTCKQKANL